MYSENIAEVQETLNGFQLKRWECFWDELLDWVRPIDEKFVANHISALKIFEDFEQAEITSSTEAVKLRPVFRYQNFCELDCELRGAVSRLLRWKKSIESLYYLTPNEMWLKLPERFPQKSLFDKHGGGIWLEKNRPALYEHVIEIGKKNYWLSIYIGKDGRSYQSYRELVVADLLFANRDILSYEAHPLLPFKGPKKKQPRSCVADFCFNLITQPERVFHVEVWMVKHASANDKLQISALETKKYKLDQYKSIGLMPSLIEIEGQLIKDGVATFLDHIFEQFLAKGIQLDPTDFDTPQNSHQFFHTASAEQIAKKLFNAKCSTVNKAKSHRDSSIRQIPDQIRARGTQLIDEVESYLAALCNRSRRTRMGEWNSTASLETVHQYCHVHQLDKPSYQAKYKRGELPIGFPASPRQTFGSTWSWTVFTGKTSRRELVFDYNEAKILVNKYLELEGLESLARHDFWKRRNSSEILKKIPKQCGNRISGGLDFWGGWPEFLNIHSTVRKP